MTSIGINSNPPVVNASTNIAGALRSPKAFILELYKAMDAFTEAVATATTEKPLMYNGTPVAPDSATFSFIVGVGETKFQNQVAGATGILTAINNTYNRLIQK